MHDQPQGVGQGHFPQHRHAEAQDGREVGGWWSRVSVISRQTNAKQGLVHLSFGWFYPLTIPGVNPHLQFSLTWVFSDVRKLPSRSRLKRNICQAFGHHQGLPELVHGPLVSLIGLVWSDPSRTTPLFWLDLECNFHWGSMRNPPQQPYMFWIRKMEIIESRSETNSTSKQATKPH